MGTVEQDVVCIECLGLMWNAPKARMLTTTSTALRNRTCSTVWAILLRKGSGGDTWVDYSPSENKWRRRKSSHSSGMGRPIGKDYSPMEVEFVDNITEWGAVFALLFFNAVVQLRLLFFRVVVEISIHTITN